MFRIKNVRNSTVAKQTNINNNNPHVAVPIPLKPAPQQTFNRQSNTRNGMSKPKPAKIEQTKPMKKEMNQTKAVGPQRRINLNPESKAPQLINTNKLQKINIKHGNLNKKEVDMHKKEVDSNKKQGNLNKKDEKEQRKPVTIEKSKEDNKILNADIVNMAASDIHKGIQKQKQKRQLQLQAQKILQLSKQNQTFVLKGVQNQKQKDIQRQKSEYKDISLQAQLQKQKQIETQKQREKNKQQQIQRQRQRKRERQSQRQRIKEEDRERQLQMKRVVQKIQARRKARAQARQAQKKYQQQLQRQKQLLASSGPGGLLTLSDPLAHVQMSDAMMDIQVGLILKMNLAGYPNQQAIQRQVQELQRINTSYLMVRPDPHNPLIRGLANFRIELFNRIGELIVKGQEEMGANSSGLRVMLCDSHNHPRIQGMSIARGLQGHIGRVLKLKKIKNQDQCAICLGEVERGSQVYELRCAHIFHKGCLQSWLNNNANCPSCRYNIKHDHY